MKSLMKVGLFAGAALFLFKDQIFDLFTPATPAAPPPLANTGSGAPAAPAPAPPANTGSGSPAPPAPSAPLPGDRTAMFSVAEKVLAATGPGAMLTADQWNWHWTQASGISQTADLFPADNRGYLMSLKDYIERRGAAGLSGLALIGRAR